MIMKSVYTLLIAVYGMLAAITSVFSVKARKWVSGRRGWRSMITGFNKGEDRVLWIHCASLGEFEQGRPLIEEIKNNRPGWKVVLTFFSPSGYEVRKDYRYADLVMYLPSDLPLNVRYFLDHVDPDLVMIVKYEFWYNYLTELRRRKIPTYLVSGIFRPSQYFFRWYGWFTRNMFSVFSHIFLQDAESGKLLEGIGFRDYTVAGDTRFDRVSQIAGSAGELPEIEAFRAGERLFVAGSTWDDDEDIITRYINSRPEIMKWIIVPHEIGPQHLARIEEKLTVPSVRYSTLSERSGSERVLIIDNIGMLSSVYRYASLAAVGGGFGKGIHNILEAACWGVPVLFGPNHLKFREATDLIRAGGAFSFTGFGEFSTTVDNILGDDALYKKAGTVCKAYIAENTGATESVLSFIFSECR